MGIEPEIPTSESQHFAPELKLKPCDDEEK